MDTVVNGYTIDLTVPMTSNYCPFYIHKAGGYKIQIGITKWPTGNCQLSSIAYLQNLFLATNCNKSDVIAILKECYRICGASPLLICIDVRSHLVDQVEKCFNIKHKYPYTSTNGSSMCLFMAKLE